MGAAVQPGLTGSRTAAPAQQLSWAGAQFVQSADTALRASYLCLPGVAISDAIETVACGRRHPTSGSQREVEAGMPPTRVLIAGGASTWLRIIAAQASTPAEAAWVAVSMRSVRVLSAEECW